ncbi:hypothetical protein FVE85_5963 [Porphyridium purpureum]|uniref:Glycosyltransferase 2-like domain-containing protein n=1 Tax=Porphyridium purpureum TaxID=35688 RepID=A0A5J4Z590_PORPP|nr:hypothetical protein FVE85_5963 [Porphyridium purpureum]|eukprot:POR5331..scf295_1
MRSSVFVILLLIVIELLVPRHAETCVDISLAPPFPPEAWSWQCAASDRSSDGPDADMSYASSARHTCVDAVVTVYTYDRPRYLLALLRDLRRESRAAEIRVAVHVIDDNSMDCTFASSDVNYFESQTRSKDATDSLLVEVTQEWFHGDRQESQRPRCVSAARMKDAADFIFEQEEPQWRLYTSKYRHGRRRYWNLIRESYALLEQWGLPDSSCSTDAHPLYFYFLPDDVRLCNNFFSRSMALWNMIRDEDEGSNGEEKISLMLHIEKSREHEAVWTNIRPSRLSYSEKILRIGWVESGNFMASRRFLEEMGFSFPYLSPERWINNPNISSGVGATLSALFVQRKKAMYRTSHSLLAHVGVGARSKMNAGIERGSTHHTIHYMDGESAYKHLLRKHAYTVAVSIASKWSRAIALHGVVDSLASQVDSLHVYLNDYEFVPSFLSGASWIHVLQSQSDSAGGDIGDIGKFWWAGGVHFSYMESHFDYHLTCDDDLMYPSDYVERMVAAAQSYDGAVFVGLHGIQIDSGRLMGRGRNSGYYASRTVFLWSDKLEHDTVVHALGTGTLCYDIHQVGPIPLGLFGAPNMADLWVARFAQGRQIPMVAVQRPQGWLKEVSGTFEDSLYVQLNKRENKKKERFVTQVAKDGVPWALFPAALKSKQDEG